MKQVIPKNGDTAVKLSKKVLKSLERKAKPFESKKDCLERIIMQNCGASNESSVKEKSKESNTELDGSDESQMEEE